MARKRRAGVAAGGRAVDWGALYADHQQMVYRSCLRFLRDEQEAREVAHEVFERAFRAVGRTSPDLQTGPWLYRIAVNACLDRLRRRVLIRWVPLEPASSDVPVSRAPDENPEREAIRQETIALVRRTLARMRPIHRTCLVLYVFQELSCQEIADRLGRTRGAVRAMLFRARQEFREIYAALGGEPVSSL